MVNLASGLAAYGRFETYIGAFFATVFICCVISLLLSGAWAVHKDVHTSTATAALSNTTCASVAANTAPHCTTTASYTVAGKPYTAVVQYSDPLGAALTSKSIFYNPSNPGDAEGEKGSMLFDLGLSVFLCLLLVAILASAFLVHKSDVAATVAGGSDLLSQLLH